MLNRLGSINHFSAIHVFSKGVAHHYLLQSKVMAKDLTGDGGHLGSREAVRELSDRILPAFATVSGTSDTQRQGFRIVVDISPGEMARVQLLAGEGVPAQSHQDWRTAGSKWDPNGPAFIFKKGAEAARNGWTNAFGDGNGPKMFYSGEDRNFFGLVPGDLKAPIHWLIMTQERFGNIMDKGFTAEHLIKLFETAYALLEEKGLNDQPIRLVANTGTGFQAGERVHLHVMVSPHGFFTMFPQDLGFFVKPDGTIEAPEGSRPHQNIIRMIDRRKRYAEFTPSHAQERAKIDAILEGLIPLL
ncbi:MAG: hypothetical protein ABIE84_01035 [bacterium]